MRVGNAERNYRGRLLDRLQLFAWLEANSFAWRNGNLSSGARIAANAGFAGTHIEDAKSAQLNAVAFGQRALHALKNRLHCHFSFGLGNAGTVDDLINDVEFNHIRLFAQECGDDSSD